MSALLDISRIDSRRAQTAAGRRSRCRDLLKKIEVEFAPLAREKSIALTLVDRRRRPPSADRTLVGRIVQNLVSNAIKYTRPGGRVLVGCRRRGGRLRLDVIDTGIGFNRDQHALIFAEFSRLDQGARMAQGLGLGLSIVKRLVTALGLTLELAEHRGPRLALLASAADGEAAAKPPPEPSRDRDASTASPASRVLCVDNERAVLDAMEGLLEGWGCDVRSARSLKEIDKDGLLLGWLPDLVLMDYHLDQTSGLDAIEWLRHNVGGHLPAALVTADRSPAVRRLAEERGIPVVTKPVKPAALRATISGLAGAAAASDGRPAGREQRLELTFLDLGRGDHRLGAAVDVELLQDRRDVRLDGRLRDRELVGDLLVHQAVAQHHQHPHLLRGQRAEPAQQRRLLVAGGQVDSPRGRRPRPGARSRWRGGSPADRRICEGSRWRRARRRGGSPLRPRPPR